MRRPYSDREKEINFWAKVGTDPETNCWPWLGRVYHDGYEAKWHAYLSTCHAFGYVPVFEQQVMKWSA